VRALAQGICEWTSLVPMVSNGRRDLKMPRPTETEPQAPQSIDFDRLETCTTCEPAMVELMDLIKRTGPRRRTEGNPASGSYL
jgi:hypothetical protein